MYLEGVGVERYISISLTTSTLKIVERLATLGEHVVWPLTRGLSMKFPHVYL